MLHGYPGPWRLRQDGEKLTRLQPLLRRDYETLKGRPGFENSIDAERPEQYC